MAEAFWVSSEKQQWRKRVNLIFMTLYIHVIINLFIKITNSKLISNYQVCGHSSSLMFNSVQPQRNDFFFHFSSSFCFGEEVTYVDLALLQCLRGCEASYKKGFESADYCPLLKAFKARMEARPKLAAYYKSERYAKHPQDTNSMMWRGRQKIWRHHNWEFQQLLVFCCCCCEVKLFCVVAYLFEKFSCAYFALKDWSYWLH